MPDMFTRMSRGVIADVVIFRNGGVYGMMPRSWLMSEMLWRRR